MPPKDDRATARIGNTTNMHKQKTRRRTARRALLIKILSTIAQL